MDINFEHYKIFYYAAKYKNITHAAAAMASNQPNVTRILKLLEAELNCKLFLREARGITLTREGERLYEHVEIAVTQLQNAREELAAQASDETGTVEIGATETALHLFLLDALRDFKKQHPKVRIKIQNHTTPEILKKLSYGSLDFAVLTTPFERKKFAVTDVCSFSEILVGGSGYQKLGNQSRDLRELETYPWVGLGKGTATYELYQAFFLEQHAQIEPDTQAASSDLLIPLIRNHFGIGFVPERMARPLLEARKLVQIPLKCQAPQRRICLAADRGRGGGMTSVKLEKYLQNIPLFDIIPADNTEQTQ